MSGLNAYIYRDCLPALSENDLNNKCTQVCVINIDGPSQPSEDIPAVKLVVRELGRGKYVHAEPVVPAVGHYTAGGCFIYTSDSRFGAVVEKLTGHAYGHPIKLHDRDEGSFGR